MVAPPYSRRFRRGIAACYASIVEIVTLRAIVTLRDSVTEHNMEPHLFLNPYRPSAGHMPPHLAGRKVEQDDFRRLLSQPVITENLILTGLRGVGKTVLLSYIKPLAAQSGWLWTGEDMTEQSSLSEDKIATRI